MSGTYPTYNCEVRQVISGDDLICMVELVVDDLYKKVRIRLDGVDTPDAYKKGPETKGGSIRNEVRSLVQGKQCSIAVKSQGRKGWVVNLKIHNGNDEPVDLNEYLRAKGYRFHSSEKRADAQTKTGNDSRK